MPANRIADLFKTQHRLGLGGVSLGNEFEKVVKADADAALQAAWDVGVRYFDVAPWYGFGLSERRFGQMLHDKPRGDYILSSKVGKLFKAKAGATSNDIVPFSGSPNEVVFDYTADGVRRSIEDSLQRMGVDHLDIVFVHDLSPDFPWYDRPWEEMYEIARKGAFPALSKLRDEGVIKGWGLGVNCPEPILKVIEDSDPDVCLCARQYSLVDHAQAVNELFPRVKDKGVALVMGSALNAGFISGSARYNYGEDNQTIPSDVLTRRDDLREIAQRHGVDLRTAALQFSAAAEPAVALVVGARSAEQAVANYNAVHAAKIPTDFWRELRDRKLVEPDARTPDQTT